jgi:MFS family permease
VSLTSRNAAGTHAVVPSAPAPTRRRRSLGPTASLVLLVSIIVSLLAASSAPTPLYPIYQRDWSFSPITTTIVFAVYAVAVLAALLVVGKISDHVGRRPVVLVALAAQAAAMVVLATAGGLPALLAGRIMQGLVTGAAVGAIGAGMLDIDRLRGGFLNSFAPASGTASGTLIAGLIVQYLPEPTHLVYYVLLGVYALQALCVTMLRETVDRKPGAVASMTPEIKLPRAVRTPAVIGALAMFTAWSLAGLYGPLSPALISGLVHSSSAVWGGLPFFVLTASGALSVLLLRQKPARLVMLLGMSALVVGMAIILVSVGSGTGGTAQDIGFFIGTAVAGVGFGNGFQAGIRMVAPLTAPHERAGVLSLLYVGAYLGLSLPSVIAGFLVVYAGGLLDTMRECGIAAMVLAVVSLAALMLKRVM